ncbi:MAG TPA: FAD-dependent oxidoreductase [Usitatibacter sp.]|nr:FAD-dependent oxidoreductase [Usitatibacter sp.]
MIVVDRIAPRSAPSYVASPQALSGGARVEVCILGAGLAGMIAAYFLSREGRAVMVLEEGPLGALQGGFEAAHLASVIERPYAVVESEQGLDAARLAAQSAAAAIDAIEAIVLREHIACEFERLDGYLIAPSADAAAGVEREFEAARRAGVAGVELIDAASIDRAPWGCCVRYPAQAHFHPTRFLAGLARAIQRAGGRIHCGVRCRRIESGGPVAVVTSEGHRIEADTLVSTQPLRTGGVLGASPAPRMAHMVGLRIPRGSVPRALYWEGSDPARWVRLRSQGPGAGEVLLVGAEDPPADDDHTAYRYLALEEWARSRFPQAGEVVQRFTGQIVQAPDMFALSTRGECDSQSVYLATGGWGTAMTRGALAGLVIRDFVDGAEMPWADLYLPEACYVPGEAARAL